MKLDQPLVSVLMPAYNREILIASAMRSILSQTLEDFELIVVDDGSTDATLQVAKSFGDKRVRVLRNETNQGISRSRNRALSESRGEFIAWLDSDDQALPMRLERQVGFLSSHDAFGLCCGRAEIVDESDRLVEITSSLPENLPLAWALLWSNPIAQSSVMIRREVLTTTGLSYDEKLEVGEDYELWCGLARHTKLAFLDDILIKYKIDEGSAYHSRIEMARKLAAETSQRYASCLVGPPPSWHAQCGDWQDPRRGKGNSGDLGQVDAWLVSLGQAIVVRHKLDSAAGLAIERDINRRLIDMLQDGRATIRSIGAFQVILKGIPLRQIFLLIMRPFRLLKRSLKKKLAKRNS